MQADKWDQPLLQDLCDVMQDASICGLGQAAPNPIRLTIKHFSEEVSCGPHARFNATKNRNH